jgi:hypothetical protein
MAEKMRETFTQNVIVNVDEKILEDMEMGKQGVIFYIIEEATNNARKHANALHIWVSCAPLKRALPCWRSKMMAWVLTWRPCTNPTISAAAWA